VNALLTLSAIVLGSIGIFQWFQLYRVGALKSARELSLSKLVTVTIPLSLISGSIIALSEIYFGNASTAEIILYATCGYLFFPTCWVYYLFLGFISSKIGMWFFWFAHGLLIIGLGYQFSGVNDGTSPFDFALGMWAVVSTLWLVGFFKNHFANTKFKRIKTLLTSFTAALPSLFLLYVLKYSIFGLPYVDKSIYAQSFATSVKLIILVAFVFVLQNYKNGTQS
jgi:hypothetical protein